MALSRRSLFDGESVVAATRTHIKVLWWPMWIALLCAFMAGWTYGMFAGVGGGWARVVVVGLFGGIFCWGALGPFLRWYCWTYTLTNLRIIEQRGVLSRTGRNIALQRINDVTYEKQFVDRFLRCGTLVLHDGRQQAGVRLHDIPHIEEFHRDVSDLVLNSNNPEVRHDRSV